MISAQETRDLMPALDTIDDYVKYALSVIDERIRRTASIGECVAGVSFHTDKSLMGRLWIRHDRNGREDFDQGWDSESGRHIISLIIEQLKECGFGVTTYDPSPTHLFIDWREK